MRMGGKPDRPFRRLDGNPHPQSRHLDSSNLECYHDMGALPPIGIRPPWSVPAGPMAMRQASGLAEGFGVRWASAPITSIVGVHARIPSCQENKGCVDYNPKSNEINEKKYQTPFWNSAGYMVYDGPVRILRNHFVNFLKDPAPLLTCGMPRISRISMPIPKGTGYMRAMRLWDGFKPIKVPIRRPRSARELSFDNVDLRHQIYTEHVNPALV